MTDPSKSGDISRLRVCVDRIAAPTSVKGRLAVSTEHRWKANAIHVRFLDEVPAAARERIKAAAQPWRDALDGKLSIFFDNAVNADVRIGCNGGGNWSWIGTQAHQQPRAAATMNIAEIDADDDTLGRVVLHEFGHALGCLHEFQNPDQGIKWNEAAVYAFYAGPPNFWSNAKTKANVLDHYTGMMTSRTAFDPDSVMMYPIPAALTLDGSSFEWRSALSPSDVAFIKKVYA